MDAWLNAINMGLTLAGVERIADLDDPDSEPARVVKEMLPNVQDSIIRSHPWNFARHYDSLPGVAPPAGPYAYRYAWRSDPYFLRVVRCETNLQWRIVGRFIHTNAESPLAVEAQVRVANPQLWDANVLQMLAIRLAQFTGTRLVNARGDKIDANALYLDRQSEARSINAQERSTHSLDDRPRSAFLESRF